MFIDHVMLHTNDVEASVRFYKELFGMEFLSFDPRHNENPPYELTFLIDPKTDLMLELKYFPTEPKYEKGSAFGHIGHRVTNAYEILGKAQRMGYEASSVIKTSSFKKTYIVGTIVTPEGVDVHIVQKIKDESGDSNGEKK